MVFSGVLFIARIRGLASSVYCAKSAYVSIIKVARGK